MNVPGTRLVLPAIPVARAATRQPDAWLQSYTTIRLTEGIVGVYLNVASEYEVGVIGHWFGLCDHVDAWAAQASRMDPELMVGRIGLVWLHAGSVLNVGVCAPAAQRGCNEQAEFVAGTPPRLQPLDDYLARFGVSGRSAQGGPTHPSPGRRRGGGRRRPGGRP